MSIKVQLLICFTVFSAAFSSASNSLHQNKSISENLIEFVENKGQLTDMDGNLRSDVLFYGSGGGKEIYLRKNGFSVVLSRMKNIDVDATGEEELFSGVTGHRIDLDFEGMNNTTNEKAYDKTGGYTNYYYGHCKDGILNVSGYTKVVYENIYPNIDVVFYGGKAEGIKYDIVVKRGGNPDDIKLKYDGAVNISLLNGELKIATSVGEIVESMPKVYQNINGKIVDVKAGYKLDGTTLNFELGTLNSAFSLIIDPWVTYYGGTKFERGDDIAIDGSGNAVVSGRAVGTGFPTSPGAFQSNFAGAMDIFVLKMDANGNRVWATYFGGSQYELAYGIICDGSSNIGVTGYTNSPNFPISAGAYQVAKNGTYDAYLLKLDAAGARLWCTFIGGSADEGGVGYDIACNAAGDFVITGNTKSNDFPCSAGAFQNTFGGGTSDAYVAKFSGAGTLSWATYLGGSGRELGYGITFDGPGNIIAVGNTDAADFPSTAGCFQAALSLGDDGYVVKFDAAGNQLWATYYGGSGTDYGSGVDVDGSNNIVFTGWTNSLDFPVSPGAYQLVNNGIFDSFFIKFSSTGNRLWSTYFGGVNIDEGFGVAIDGNDDIYFFGDTYSPDFPVTSCAYQTYFGGDEDFYVTKFDGSGSLICSGFLGDLGHDEANSGGHIAVDAGYIYVVGSTPGPFPVTPGAYQSVMGGVNDAIIAKLCSNTCGGIEPVEANFGSDATQVNCGTKVNFNDLSSLCDTTTATYQWFFPGGNPSTSVTKNPQGIEYNIPGSYAVALILMSFCGADTLEQLDYIVVSGASASVDAGPDQTIMLGASTLINSSPGVSYSWIPSSGLSCTDCASPVASPEETTTYYVTVKTAGGCEGMDSLTINIQTCFDERSLFIPNTFTPDGDNINEKFKAYGNDIYSFNMKIFDRWGNKIFESSNIDNAWEGKVEGEMAMQDVYVYRIVYSSACSQGNKVEETGHLILLK